MKKLLAIGLFFAVLMGCKKEIQPVTPPEDLSRANRSSERRPDIIVHHGGSIQAAVDAASPGFIIHIQPGIYREAVIVNKPGIQLIGMGGEQHEGVIIENPGDADNGITVLSDGDGFVLKNVTIKNFKENGLFMERADNFLLSHVVTINNGEYGLFPVFCKNGVIEYCSATGHTDTGIYVGQSENISMVFNTAFGNVNGFEIENSSHITASKNICYDNSCGILVSLLPGLPIKTATDNLVEHNIVYDNNHVNFSNPGGGFENFIPVGSGILIVGSDHTTVKQNTITGNHFVGVATVSTVIIGAIAGIPPEAFADIEPNPDGTRVIENTIMHNGSAPPAGLPLPGVDILWDGSGTNNCWMNNIYTTSYPTPLPSCN